MNYEYPLVSIGMPVYNSEKTIDRALDSLLTQDYPNIEIIVSDNSSTDKTADLCKKYAKRDDRIKFNINEKNLGVNANFWIVYKKAVGKHFMWAGGDDYWEPEFIKTLVKELESDPGIGVALCAVRREYPDGSLKDIIQFNGRYNPNNLSNTQITANLLTPNKQIKLMKYNLFICGLFNYQAINEALPAGDDTFKYGERAFLSQLALAYRFRYVDKVLFVKTIQRTSYHERHPNDEYAQDLKRFVYWRYYPKIIVWTYKSTKIPRKNKLFILTILYFIAYGFVHKRKKKFLKLKKKFSTHNKTM
jgi:glycosyltransferase involved in cell wall biosynthesis